jgi:methylmalonyl-CoA/ethylmalonyl-CoA epimerase
VTNSGTPLFTGISQIGIVVRDLDAAVARYWSDLGIGPWRIFTIDPANTPGMTLRGRPVEHAFRAALAMVGATQLELIEPGEGPSLYAEHLDEHGEGVHHVAFGVSGLDDARARLAESGFPELQGGRTFGSGEYVYVGLPHGLIAELGRAGEMPEPDSVYPPAS